MKDFLKRLVDLCLSGLAIILVSPLLLLIMLWIKLDSPGPVFFKQRRIGRNQEVFRIYKFRSMHDRAPDAIDQHNEKVVASNQDPRITRAGRFLRNTSLDELPQLWNIARGDMSIVGPRPIIPEQLEVVGEAYKERFDVPPGLTGLAQIRGRRSLGWLQQLEADTEYARNYSIMYDFKIMLKTVVVVFKRSDIYGGDAQNWRAYRDSLRQTDDSGEDKEL
ncbi:sugar transferase [Halomonas sp. M20]|uniref:sugar transferase n=1 Tax=Halomonas sp. M20 TaxID=2763264 RepID=UPI001D0A625E|nr:sugar transferase [Halomonas sp. M20]